MSSERLRTKIEERAKIQEPPRQSPVRSPPRRWSDEEKLAIVRECELPGSSASIVSRRHDINTNLIFNWRRQVQRCRATIKVRAPDNQDERVFRGLC